MVRIPTWSDSWLDGKPLSILMPHLVEAMPSRLRCRHTVASALMNSAWIHNIKGALSIPVLVQYLHLRERLQDQTLSSDAD
jgi:hypothetical protein